MFVFSLSCNDVFDKVTQFSNEVESPVIPNQRSRRFYSRPKLKGLQSFHCLVLEDKNTRFLYIDLGVMSVLRSFTGFVDDDDDDFGNTRPKLGLLCKSLFTPTPERRVLSYEFHDCTSYCHTVPLTIRSDTIIFFNIH